MLRLDVRMIRPNCRALRVAEGLLKLRGEFVEGVYGRDGYMRVSFSLDELVSVFGLDADGDIACGNTNALMDRTHKYHKQRGEEMIEMITSGDPEKFYKYL